MHNILLSIKISIDVIWFNWLFI